MPTIAANGLEIAYTVDGAGPPLVLLHGASSSGAADFGRVLPALRGGFRCHVPDARGHGGTRWDAADGLPLRVAGRRRRSPSSMRWGSRRSTCSGSRWAVPRRSGSPSGIPGGCARSCWPGSRPSASPAPRSPGGCSTPTGSRRRTRNGPTELSARHDPVQGPGAWQRLLPAIARDVASQELQGPADLVGIDCPVLLVVGDRDPFVPADQAWRLKRQLPDARLLVAPDCGHEVLLRRPALAIEALAGFYRSTEAVAARRAEAASDAAPGRTRHRHRQRHHDRRPTWARTSRTARSHPTRTGSRRRPDDRRPRAFARQRGVPRG